MLDLRMKIHRTHLSVPRLSYKVLPIHSCDSKKWQDSILLRTKCYSTVRVWHVFLIHSSADGHTGADRKQSDLCWKQLTALVLVSVSLTSSLPGVIENIQKQAKGRSNMNDLAPRIEIALRRRKRGLACLLSLEGGIVPIFPMLFNSQTRLLLNPVSANRSLQGTTITEPALAK